MLWHTFLVRVNFDVFDKFKILLRHKYEINLCIRRTWLIGFEMTISFCKESVTNDKIICQRKNKDRQHFVTSWNLASIPVPVTTNITILFYLVNQKSQIKDYHLYFIELSRPVCGANTDKTVRISSQINGSIDTILSDILLMYLINQILFQKYTYTICCCCCFLPHTNVFYKWK